MSKLPYSGPVVSGVPTETTPYVDHGALAEERSWILSFVSKGGLGAEFGVFRGHFADVIAREAHPRRLFLVDPWTKAGKHFNWGPDPYTDFDKLTTEQALADTRERMSKWETSSEIVYVEDTLENFTQTFEVYSQEKLDFVYLDTTHAYEDTLRQLRSLRAILKNDGIILGDDWFWDISHVHHGVMRAVNDFLKESNFQLVFAGKNNQFCLRRKPQYE